jgi:hypothetical protein
MAYGLVILNDLSDGSGGSIGIIDGVDVSQRDYERYLAADRGVRELMVSDPLQVLESVRDECCSAPWRTPLRTAGTSGSTWSRATRFEGELDAILVTIRDFWSQESEACGRTHSKP